MIKVIAIVGACVFGVVFTTGSVGLVEAHKQHTTDYIDKVAK